MKNLIISVICLLLLMAPWSVYHRFSKTSTVHYKDTITNQTIPAAKSGDWEHAESSFNSITKDWDKFRKISAYFIDTKSINDVTAQMSKVSCYIRQHDAVNSLAEADALRHELDCLYKNEAPSVGNIF